MKFKKYVFMITVVAIISILFSSHAFAENIDLREHINEYIKNFYEVEWDFYPETTEINGHTYHLNLAGRLEEYNKYGVLLNPLTYGSDGTTEISGWGNVPSIGYNIVGKVVRPPFTMEINPYEESYETEVVESFYHWGTWTQTPLYLGPVPYWKDKIMDWVDEGCPGNEWSNGTVNAFKCMDFSIEGMELMDEGEQRIDLLDDAIQTGMDIVYGNPNVKGDMIRKEAPASKRIHSVGQHPEGGRWIDYIKVIIPPTDISWGLGMRINGSGRNQTKPFWSIDIPIAPFKMVENLDLSAHFSEQIATANEGDEVTFTAEAYSNEKAEKEDVSYEWRITDFSGNLIDATYSGEGDSQTGTFSINSDVPKIFKATFTMPAHGVNVSFTVNGDEKYTEENYDNNTVQMSVGLLFPEPPQRLGEVILDYDIYARNQDSNLAYMTANLPSGLDYVGTGSARINSYTENASILYDYQYQTGASVNSAPFTIDPWYKGLILRSGFGDMPEWSTYLANGIYQEDVAEVSDGYAKRQYRYTITGEDGEPITRYSTVTAYFPDTTSHLPVTARVYNGVPYLSAPVTQNNVTGANLKWTSVPITFNVNRKMYRMDLYGNRVDERIVPGQYVRTFTDQNSASVVWSVVTSQAQGYEQDRRTAKNRGTSYHNAIFATDKQFSNVDYPIKSGYMFNPVGVYRCVVNSTVYYDSAASEAEKKQTHEELVNKVINSFVYDNKMTYTYNGQDNYDFTNVTSASPKDILHIRRDDNVNIALIPHTQYQTCMEGYEESGTIDSFNSYKYREYVAADRVSRIDAQTVITFTVSSSSKRYTHINMKDGNYSISAFSNPFPFKGLTAPGVHLRDSITVSVKGSVYDDRG